MPELTVLRVDGRSPITLPPTDVKELINGNHVVPPLPSVKRILLVDKKKSCIGI